MRNCSSEILKLSLANSQLDFNLPQAFDLKYRAAEASDSIAPGSQFQRPVMIHRALFGSLERFIAIVTESTGGKW